MKKRLLYGSAIFLLAVSVTLVVWQGSFNFGEYAPADPTQTLVYWAISSLTFLLMVTLGFILFRTGVRLYIERRSNREGSRIRTKMVIGALALSFMPAIFLVLFSVHILNVNLDKWFNKPVQDERGSFNELSTAFIRSEQQRIELEAELLALQPEVQVALLQGTPAPGFLEQYRKQRGLAAAALFSGNDLLLDQAGSRPLPLGSGQRMVVARKPVETGGGVLGQVVVAAEIPLDVALKRAAVERSNAFYAQLAGNRKQIRQYYWALMALITLFVLFVATWIARILSDQISAPISALLRAAGEIRKGNLKHRVNVRAIDELASLVRAFNDMCQELEANSRELDARRRFTEAILENIPTGVISIAADGSIQRVNRALKRIFPEELVRRAGRLEDLFSREDTAEIKYWMKRARRTGLASGELELRTERQVLHLAVTVSALEERLNSGFVIVLEDMSELLRAQKAAAWHEVARRVAHEIKNPLTPISLSAERICRQLERIDLPESVRRVVRECADTICGSVETVKTLSDEFSQFARFPAAQPVRCDLNEVVQSALAVFNGRLEGIEVQVQLAAGLPPVSIDKEQFKRVIVNLVDNAAEALQDSLVKNIWIATQWGAADTVELIVADSGCGITAEQKEKLFLPYFSTKGRGTGLGLAIVNHIVSDHHASIRVEDNLPAGARFIIEIPAAGEADTTDTAARPASVVV